ncbi:energy-coupling factor ABC transporter ATP-binding protein [Infirmifilum sp. NZ]|uniref:energy-coupling factor ABC transporter ATP-binding protein n=1 Tax=Infirmifilum sp. NZ TaxID=2926850 RepID=UPI00279FF26D|nr:ABC transporter ATP-binding protein [Infirmifilum sp. NZ]UNQ72679.1 energy-coupling factor ABC transporter ATP-binding protein [Infirmifilum sp. NZ]
MLLELKNVYYRYPDSDGWILRNINLEANAGEFILLLGPSGCGKSTLARILNGLIPNFYGGELVGHVSIKGLDPRKTPTYELAKHVGFVFQNPENQLFFTSVEREIAFGLENAGLPPEEIRRRVENVLREYGLWELRNRSPFELSGGQQQRVALASVMVLEPEILVLDEPTANLDPLTALKVLGLVKKKVQSSRILALVIEHRLEVALPFADRVVVMNEGEVVFTGRPLEGVKKYGYITGKPFIVKFIEKLEEYGLQINPKLLTPEHVAAEARKKLQGEARGAGN